MKEISLEGFNVTEINETDLLNVTGGQNWRSGVAAGLSIITYIYDSWDDFTAGFRDGYRSTQK